MKNKKLDLSFLLYSVPIFIFIILPLIGWFMTTDPGLRPVSSNITIPAYQTQEFGWAFEKTMRIGFLLIPLIFTPVIIHHIIVTEKKCKEERRG